MKPLPHTYLVTANAEHIGNLTAQAEGLPDQEIAPPLDFDGPGNIWSPEDLLMSSIASCTILTFRAIAKASGLEWLAISCKTRGILEHIERKTRFTQIHSQVQLTLPVNAPDSPDREKHIEKAKRLLLKAEQSCLISNSLSAKCDIECEITFQASS